ncbi:hypothetical protein MY4824_003507 [Beauveria thailandica]
MRQISIYTALFPSLISFQGISCSVVTIRSGTKKQLDYLKMATVRRHLQSRSSSILRSGGINIGSGMEQPFYYLNMATRKRGSSINARSGTEQTSYYLNMATVRGRLQGCDSFEFSYGSIHVRSAKEQTIDHLNITAFRRRLQGCESFRISGNSIDVRSGTKQAIDHVKMTTARRRFSEQTFDHLEITTTRRRLQGCEYITVKCSSIDVRSGKEEPSSSSIDDRSGTKKSLYYSKVATAACRLQGCLPSILISSSVSICPCTKKLINYLDMAAFRSLSEQRMKAVTR